MALIRCRECGNEVSDQASRCVHCGAPIVKEVLVTPTVSQPKVKVPGKGLSIASMVLGIVAAVWTLFELLALDSIDTYSAYTYYELSEVIGYAIGFTLFALIPSILGFIFSLLGFKKKKSGFNVSGIVLNSVSLGINLLVIIYIFSVMYI